MRGKLVSTRNERLAFAEMSSSVLLSQFKLATWFFFANTKMLWKIFDHRHLSSSDRATFEETIFVATNVVRCLVQVGPWSKLELTFDGSRFESRSLKVNFFCSEASSWTDGEKNVSFCFRRWFLEWFFDFCCSGLNIRSRVAAAAAAGGCRRRTCAAVGGADRWAPRPGPGSGRGRGREDRSHHRKLNLETPRSHL